jgi:hypothetical protein
VTTSVRAISEEGLTVSAELGNEADIVHCLEGLASVAGAEGRIVRAARLWGAEEALLEEIEAVYTYVPDRSRHKNQVAARSQIDEASWKAAWAEGRTMTSEQAIEYALEQEAAPRAGRPGGIPRRAQRQGGRSAAPGRHRAEQRRGRQGALPQLPHRRLAP